jgi:hypothetical protein
MPKTAILPLVHTFVVCREIFQDARSGEYILVGPTNGFLVTEYPCAIPVAVYGDLSDVRGEYTPALQLVDSDGEAIWSERAPRPMELVNPLGHHHFVFYDLRIRVPRPGRYDLLLMADKMEIARHGLKMERVGEVEGGPSWE